MQEPGRNNVQVLLKLNNSCAVMRQDCVHVLPDSAHCKPELAHA